MAKPAWLTTTPESGNGNGAIQNSASAHTGREVRIGTVTVTATGVSNPKTYSVTQKAKPEFVSFNDGTEMSAPKEGGKVTISGKSNSKILTFAFVGDAKEVSLPEQYTANGSKVNNGVMIDGDPGKSAEFDVSLELTLPANTTVEEVTRTIKVTTEGGQTAQIAVKQAAGDPTLEITPDSIQLEASGKAVSVSVKSNTAWTVS